MTDPERLTLVRQHAEHPAAIYLQDLATLPTTDEATIRGAVWLMPEPGSGDSMTPDDDIGILDRETAIVILVASDRAERLVEAILALDIR